MILARTLALVAVVHVSTSSAPRADPVRDHRTAVYVEAFGAGGLWGVGVDHRIHSRWALGAVGGGGSSEDQSYLSLTPYAAVDVLRSRSGHHAWLVDAGAQLAHVWNESPVPEWDGTSQTGVGGMLSSGYEYRNRILFRVFAQTVFGKGGIAPWLGADIGMTL